MKAAYGFFSRKITVYASGVSTRVMRSQPSRVSTFVRGSRIVFTVKATSAEVNGFPSCHNTPWRSLNVSDFPSAEIKPFARVGTRSEEHTSELQSRQYLVCRLLLEKKK